MKTQVAVGSKCLVNFPKGRQGVPAIVLQWPARVEHDDERGVTLDPNKVRVKIAGFGYCSPLIENVLFL